MKIGVLVCLLPIILLTQVAKAYQESFVGDVRVASEPTCTQIFIQVPKRTGYVAKDSTSPPRIVLNLYPVRMDLPYKEIPVVDKFIQKICLLRDSANVVKTTVDLNTSKYSFNVYSQTHPSAVVVEIGPLKKDVVQALLGIDNTEVGQTQRSPFSLGPWHRVPERNGETWKIVIDPGHGGKDPGAIGPSGVKEKDITLAIAYRLLRLLNQNPKFQVYLTRKGDEFVSLDRRTEIANQVGGDIFISIHANAAWDSQARGVETFFNSHYPYGEGAEEVALRENAVLGPGDVPASVKNIIWDLIQNQYRKESESFSRILQQEIVKVCNTRNRGVKSAPFYVLRGANMPSVLLEVGFISNPWEERKLKSSDYQDLIASGIYKGIVKYTDFIESAKGESSIRRYE